MDILSSTLVQANREMKKARWTYDGAVRAKASKRDQDDLWLTYTSIQDSVAKIQHHLERIGVARAEVAKARWWLDVGVYSESTLGLIYPLDSQRVSKIRLDHAVEQAQEAYVKAAKALDNLLAPIPVCSDPWLEQERQRLVNAERAAETQEAITAGQAEQAVLAAADAAQKESEEIQAWCEDYLLLEQQRFDQRRVRFQTEVNRTVSECNQKVREIRSAVSSRPH
jgi:hypothetical protein